MITHARRLLATAAALATFIPQAAGAQQDVMRDAFGFFGSSLDVLVETEAPGRIRLVRGQRSRIEVAGRSADGFTSAALGGRGVRRLTLTALGTERVDFIVVVPEDVRVRVYRPGTRNSELFGTLAETATYAWDTPQPRPAFETVRPATRPATATPRSLDVRSAYRLDRLTLRVGGDRFAISPRGIAEVRGQAGSLGFDAMAGEDVTVDVPVDERFTLRLDGVDAVVIDNGTVRVLCESILSQTFPDGRQWLTLTPEPRDGCTHGGTPALPPPADTPPGRRT